MLREQLPRAQPAADGIPLIPAEALAGKGTGEVVIEEYMIEQRYAVPEFSGATCLIRVKGDSMAPTYLPGDLIALKRIEHLVFIQWNRPHVVDTDQGILLKRVLQGKGSYLLRSDNPAYPDIELPGDAVHRMFIALGIIRLE